MIMALKAIIFLVASVLLVTSRVSSKEEETFLEASYAKPGTPVLVPAPAPVKAPAPVPVKPPVEAPPVPVPVKPPVKAPPVPAPVKPPVPAPAPKLLPPVNVSACPRLCGGRCKLHSRLKHCMRVCVTCCTRCKCVPPGTYGNKEMCGKCYTDMTTHGNRPKCP